MNYNYIDTNLCNFTDQIMDIWAAKRAEQKYFPDSALSSKIDRDTLQTSAPNNNNTMATAIDGKDDGKISFKEKIQNFGKGLIAPIKTMFSSPKNIAITAASVAGGAALIALTGGAAAPVMVALGLIGGGVQIGQGIYKQVNAKTDAQARQAWQQMGSGTFTAGVSAAGAKSSLKAAGVKDVKNMSVLKAMWQCIKDIPKNLKNGFSTASAKISNAAQAAKTAADTAATTPKSKTSAHNESTPIEPEIIDSTEMPNIPNARSSKPDIIDVDFVEINDAPPAKNPILGLEAGNITKRPALPAPEEQLRLTAKPELKRLSAKPEPLRLEAPKDNNTTPPSKDGIGNKIKNFFKLFGFFKPDNNS